MIVKVKNETFWFSTYSVEMHSLTSSSFIICLWGETFGLRTILLWMKWNILGLQLDSGYEFPVSNMESMHA